MIPFGLLNKELSIRCFNTTHIQEFQLVFYFKNYTKWSFFSYVYVKSVTFTIFRIAENKIYYVLSSVAFYYVTIFTKVTNL